MDYQIIAVLSLESMDHQIIAVHSLELMDDQMIAVSDFYIYRHISRDRHSLISGLINDQGKYLSGIPDYFPEAKYSGTLYKSSSGHFEVL
jgi:hypothetical protein